MDVDDEEENEEELKLFGFITFKHAISGWLCIMSFWNWFNLITAPHIMLYPELWPRSSIILWLQEICFLFDIVRKSFVAKEKSMTTDFYEIFIEYAMSTMIFDLIPIVPNIFGGLNPKFAFLKILRIHDIAMLYYIFTLIIQWKNRNHPKSISDD